MSMNWFRWYHGTISDPKIALISKKSKQSRSTVIAVWAALLEQASQAEDRGDVSGFDAETIAVALDIEDDDLGSILTAMMTKGMIQDQRITSWSKRQPQREDGAAERAKAWRERKRTQANADERSQTLVNAGERQEEEEDKDTDADTDKESLKQTAVGEKEERSASQAPPRAPKAPSSSSSKAQPIPKAVIRPDWTPAENTYALLQRQGIDPQFAESCIDEFRLYWTERQEARPGWESTFVNNVKRAWEHRASTPSPRPPVNATKHDRLIDNSRQAINAWLVPQNVIEGECHEIH